MDKLLPILQKCELFQDLPGAFLLHTLLPKGEIRTFTRQSVLITPQSPVSRLGVLASGRIQIVQLYSDGASSLMSTLKASDPLGADLICTETRRAPYHAVAAADSQVIFFPVDLLLTPGRLPEQEQLNIERRLLALLSHENVRKHYRLAVLSQRGLRDRILTYLTMQAGELNSRSFCIPFTREELADYLCVNRSALSHELSLMEKDGLIRFRKNRFTLLAAGERRSTWKFLG